MAWYDRCEGRKPAAPGLPLPPLTPALRAACRCGLGSNQGTSGPTRIARIKSIPYGGASWKLLSPRCLRGRRDETGGPSQGIPFPGPRCTVRSPFLSFLWKGLQVERREGTGQWELEARPLHWGLPWRAFVALCPCHLTSPVALRMWLCKVRGELHSGRFN